MFKFVSKYFTYLLGVVILSFPPISSNAASIIRDTEVEASIRLVIDPILVAAGLSPQGVQVYIVNDPEINAYVSGGQNIFINTGLLRLSDTPSMLMGVVAHESGHIAGGHLIRGQNDYKATVLKSTVGFLLGLAASAAGSADAGQAIIAGSSHIANRELLKHTRTQEESADQAALSYLDKVGYSAQGLLDLLQILYNKENTLYDKRNPYTLTHPLSRERMDYVRSHLKDNHRTHPISATIAVPFKLSITKLNAFLDDPKKTLNQYPSSDRSTIARYARSIAYYRIPQLTNALAEIDSLIQEFPSNPYFLELKGQILLENGHVQEAIIYYEQAKTLLPQAPLIRIELAGAYLATEDNKKALAAVDNLELALPKERENSFIWRQLAIAYGRSNQLGMSNLALAEEALLTNNIPDAEQFVRRADEYITANSPAALRRQDLLKAIERAKKEPKK